MPLLSLIIITKNEEAHIAACLESVRGLADEIILVDSRSTDKTLEIASKYKAKIFTRDFDSFTSQKAYALAQARGEWVLNLDADEELSPALREEIKNTLKDAAHDAFLLPISNFF
ncbi:MAG: glycosyltransferase family 2 protein [Elusimicrobiota bacterium]|jgi:glycosyltransferase involved in cell wall biosynthesis|nr:glycosyltransferase family 2 protein [Elusimicrobiota bacterium]